MNFNKPLYSPPTGFDPLRGQSTPMTGLGSLASGGTTTPTLPGLLRPTWQSGTGFSKNVQRPQSCGSERDKVANLRRLIAAHEADIKQIERFKDTQDLINGAYIVTAVVLETSIAFLDLAAAMLKPINKGAYAYAKAGLLSIETAGTVSEVAYGQRSVGSAVGHLADKSVDTAFSLADPKSIAGKYTLNTAKMHYDAALIAIKASFGADTNAIKTDSFDFVKDRAKGISEIVAQGLKDNDYKKVGKSLEGLVVVAEMYEAGARYHGALEQRMNEYFNHKEWVADYVSREKVRLLQLIGGFKKDLRQAVADLEACELGR
ncbi:MAG: hypothetical protein ACU0CI_09800 [Shimia sp.]